MVKPLQLTIRTQKCACFPPGTLHLSRVSDGWDGVRDQYDWDYNSNRWTKQTGEIWGK